MDKERNSFVLYRNYKKVKPNQPDLTGRMTLNGVEYRISGWRRSSKSGNTIITGAIELKVAYKENKKDDQNLIDDITGYINDDFNIEDNNVDDIPI